MLNFDNASVYTKEEALGDIFQFMDVAEV